MATDVLALDATGTPESATDAFFFSARRALEKYEIAASKARAAATPANINFRFAYALGFRGAGTNSPPRSALATSEELANRCSEARSRQRMITASHRGSRF